MDEVSITVRAAEGVRLLPEQQCYVGPVGAISGCSQVWQSDNQAVFSHNNLNPYEQVTIAQQVVLSQSPQLLERYRTVYVWAFGYTVVLGGLIVYLLRWRLRYKSKKSIIAQYEPYRSFSPLFTGVLLDNRLDSKDITAGIVSLAERGVISITETKEKILFFFESNDYLISLLKPQEVLVESDRKLLDLLDLNDGSLGTTLSALRKDTSQQRNNHLTLLELKKAVKADMVALGFIQKRGKKEILRGITATFIAAVAAFAVVALYNSWGFILTMLIVSVIVLLVTMGLERRTALGYEAIYHLKGFKDFLSTTDKERFKFHNAPALNSQQFMEYLPYAIAFGVEKEWAEVFEDIPLMQPSWYSSQNNSTFNVAVFTQNLSSFSSSLSTSSGSSGSSGSGSAGGGGGGGGGGSW